MTMNSAQRSVLWCSSWLLVLGSLCAAQTRVAFLGDSITAGQGSGPTPEDTAHARYPAVVARLLGSDFEVQGFGAHGHSLRTDAKQVYANSKAFERALLFKPEVAVIMLGTNDSAMEQPMDDWRGSLERLLKPLREARPGARVLLASPPEMFPEAKGLKEERKQWLTARRPRLHAITDSLRSVARELDDVEFVDLRSTLRPQDVSDGVHPNAFGAERIGYRLAGALQMQPGNGPAPAVTLLGQRPDAKRSSFHGFQRFDFKLQAEWQGSPRCVLVAPDRIAPGAPWIWRARFFGHQPALDRALLDRGFHLAYVDIAGLFGSSNAVRRMGIFQDLCEDLGLGSKPILEGMSRGGLAIVEYAKAHPDRVSALYGDNPVVDLLSWPGGKSGNRGKRSEPEWAQAEKEWGILISHWLSDDASEWAVKHGPLAGLDGPAKAGVPMMLVMGTADTVVPAHENGERLQAAYLAAGGAVQVWRKPGLGHHPHGLHPVAPLLRALLVAAGVHSAESEPSITATPSAEHRGRAAGWGGGTWPTAFASLQELAKAAESEPPMDVVFLGDSITQGLTGHSGRTANPQGERIFDLAQAGRRAVSLGLSGDRTEHLLHRIAEGSLDAFRPRVIVLQIGVNNINAARHTGEETYRGIVRVVEALRQRLPDAQVLIAGPFPAGTDPQGRVRRSIAHVHTRLAEHSFDAAVTYQNLAPLFVDPEGALLPTLKRDAIHIGAAGQQAWMDAIAPTISQALSRVMVPKANAEERALRIPRARGGIPY